MKGGYQIKSLRFAFDISYVYVSKLSFQKCQRQWHQEQQFEWHWQQLQQNSDSDRDNDP